MLPRLLFASGIAFVALTARDAPACVCARFKSVVVLAPNRLDETPRNTRVRLELSPNYVEGSSARRVVLRATGSGTIVPTLEYGPTPKEGVSAVMELAPRTLLEPRTRYEVAVLSPKVGAYPSTQVVTTFVTGTTIDTVPPELDPLGKVTVGGLPKSKSIGVAGGVVVIVDDSCGGDTPHVAIDRVSARDPERPNARLVYGVWLGDRKTGKIDYARPPTGIFLAGDSGSLVIGARDSCAMEFPFPDAPSATLGVAALDEAGNQSKPQTLSVALR